MIIIHVVIILGKDIPILDARLKATEVLNGQMGKLPKLL